MLDLTILDHFNVGSFQYKNIEGDLGKDSFIRIRNRDLLRCDMVRFVDRIDHIEIIPVDSKMFHKLTVAKALELKFEFDIFLFITVDCEYMDLVSLFVIDDGSLYQIGLAVDALIGFDFYSRTHYLASSVAAQQLKGIVDRLTE